MKAASQNCFNDDALSMIANECLQYEKHQYNNYVMGKIGNDTDNYDKKVEDDVLTIIETCNEFARPHETDHFKLSVDIVYTGDEAYPDHQQHGIWSYRQNYDQRKNEYDIVRAQRALRATSRARAAGA